MEYAGKGSQIKRLARQGRHVPHVAATTPFIISQVMLTAHERVAGRGRARDRPRTGRHRNDLEKNIRKGSLLDLNRATGINRVS